MLFVEEEPIEVSDLSSDDEVAVVPVVPEVDADASAAAMAFVPIVPEVPAVSVSLDRLLQDADASVAAMTFVQTRLADRDGVVLRVLRGRTLEAHALQTIELLERVLSAARSLIVSNN